MSYGDYGAPRVNGHMGAGQFLTGDLKFYTVYFEKAVSETGVNLAPAEFADRATNMRFAGGKFQVNVGGTWTDTTAANGLLNYKAYLGGWDNNTLEHGADTLAGDHGELIQTAAQYMDAYTQQVRLDAAVSIISQFAAPVIMTKPVVFKTAITKMVSDAAWKDATADVDAAAGITFAVEHTAAMTALPSHGFKSVYGTDVTPPTVAGTYGHDAEVMGVQNALDKMFTSTAKIEGARAADVYGAVRVVPVGAEVLTTKVVADTVLVVS